ncbi:ABC transporter ATP-binding protein [Clostridium akagii]|uniref:ABC transporter ATP-binding protein n=1 Tax=Clostridium akagii TaxID=91623 RepID=UPI00047BFBC2|nr:ABC transporter ATP-binding protein [Clostridium akagii]
MIALKNINKSYAIGREKFYALKDINLKLYSGEFVAIIGPSGSGKTTLMNIIGCLDTPDSGEYYIDDENVAKLNDSRLAEIRNCKIGFVFQRFNLLPRLTAFENVELPLVYRGLNNNERYEKTMKSIEMVGIIERMKHKPSEMSGGQQQRTAIARAIAGEPEIILADEPTGNLDSKSGKEIMNILTRLNNQGKTLMLITHDKEMAKYAQRIIRISDGKIN